MERLTMTFVFMILLAAAIVGHYYWRLNERTQELAELRVLVNQAKTNLQSKEAHMETRRRSLEVANGIVAENKTLTEDQTELMKQLLTLESQYAEVQKKFVEAVTKVRKAAVELPPQDVILKNGQVLNAAKVQRMSDSEMTFQHAGGISRVDVAVLPPELWDRFRQQMPPFSVQGGSKDPLTPPPAPKTKKK
jgi:hypothetical protein